MRGAAVTRPEAGSGPSSSIRSDPCRARVPSSSPAGSQSQSDTLHSTVAMEGSATSPRSQTSGSSPAPAPQPSA